MERAAKTIGAKLRFLSFAQRDVDRRIVSWIIVVVARNP